MLLRELAITYAKISDVQRGECGDLNGALISCRKSLEIFETLARLLPNNVQAQRDLAVNGEKIAELEARLVTGFSEPKGSRELNSRQSTAGHRSENRYHVAVSKRRCVRADLLVADE